MRKWPYLLLLLGACSGGDDHPAMLGDCMTCGQAPISAGGSSGPSDATLGNDADAGNANAGDVGLFDALSIVEVGVNLDAPIPP